MSAVWYVLAFLLLLALGQAFFFTLQSGRTIQYSEFKNLVRQGKVQEVVVAEDRVRGKLKTAENGQSAFVAIRIEDPQLLQDLDKAGVRYTGEVSSKWLPELLGWIIPLLFLVGIWSFFFRRIGGP